MRQAANELPKCPVPTSQCLFPCLLVLSNPWSMTLPGGEGALQVRDLSRTYSCCPLLPSFTGRDEDGNVRGG